MPLLNEFSQIIINILIRNRKKVVMMKKLSFQILKIIKKHSKLIIFFKKLCNKKMIKNIKNHKNY